MPFISIRLICTLAAEWNLGVIYHKLLGECGSGPCNSTFFPFLFLTFLFVLVNSGKILRNHLLGSKDPK